MLIDLEILTQKNLLTQEEITPPLFPEDSVDYGEVIKWKFPILEKAFENFSKNANVTDNAKFNNFIIKNR